MNMKKILACVGLMLGYTGLNYGMDISEDIAKNDWAAIVHKVAEANPENVSVILKQLCTTKADLNAQDGDTRTLFEVLLRCAAAEKSDTLPHKQANTRLVLKELWKKQKIYLITSPHSDQEKALSTALAEEMQQELTDEAYARLAPQLLQRRRMFYAIVIGIAAIAYVVYRWKTQKVDKAAQEEDANQDTGHAVV